MLMHINFRRRTHDLNYGEVKKRVWCDLDLSHEVILPFHTGSIIHHRLANVQQRAPTCNYIRQRYRRKGSGDIQGSTGLPVEP